MFFALLILVPLSLQHFVLCDQSKVIPPSCNSSIYCQGQLLDAVQMSYVYDDSKYFVDMSMNDKPQTVLSKFTALMKQYDNEPQKEVLYDFIERNFKMTTPASWTPPDFKEMPRFLEKVTKRSVWEFCRDVLKIWVRLSRKVDIDVEKRPDMHSLIYIPNGFIASSGRFQEYYYWDSYWIVQGLLVSEMYDTVRGILDNFCYLIKKYGFVPNGGRVYYLNRSQPPLLMKMVSDYVTKTNDTKWVKANIAVLATELNWWQTKQFITVKSGGNSYRMATYKTKSLGPRPEAYREDIKAAEWFKSEEDKQELYNELKSATQSGWNFSSRWIFLSNGGVNANISYTNTSRVVPVDLNAILYGAFLDISTFYKNLGMVEEQMKWQNESVQLRKAIKAVLWDDHDGIWYDYDTKLSKKRKLFFDSNFTPLWTNAYDKTTQRYIGHKVIEYIKREHLEEFKGGIPVTKTRSGEQWDMPNAYANLQHMIVYGLLNTEQPAAIKMAKHLVKNWISANIQGFQKSKHMYDKYDVNFIGEYGGGGEYFKQSGFGWTNGVVLDFVHLFYGELGRAGVKKLSWILNFFPFCLCVKNFMWDIN